MKSAEQKELVRLRKENETLHRRMQVLEQLMQLMRELPATTPTGKTDAPVASASGGPAAKRRTSKRRSGRSGPGAGSERADAVDMGARGGAEPGASASPGVGGGAAVGGDAA